MYGVSHVFVPQIVVQMHPFSQNRPTRPYIPDPLSQIQTTLKEVINAALIFVELVFADRGLYLNVFCGTNFADTWIRNILRLIFADEQRLKVYEASHKNIEVNK